MNAESEDKVLDAFWFPFVVRIVSTNHVWAGFGCMQVGVESKKAKDHSPDYNDSAFY